MLDIQPFREKHIDDAARLFVKRYRAVRAALPLLPSRYEKAPMVSSLLAGICREHQGAVALSNTKLTGYLIAYAGIPYFKGINRGIYVPEWAHCADEGCDRERVYQSLYEEMADRWVSGGCFTHAVTLYATDDDLKDLFQWLGFGFLVVDAIREVVPLSVPQSVPVARPVSIPISVSIPDPVQERGSSGLVIRGVTPDDSKDLENLHDGLRRFLRGSPAFLQPAIEKDAVRSFFGDRVCTVAAFQEGEMVSCMRGTPVKEDGCDTVKDPDIMGIDFAYTVAGFRRRGIATSILNQVLQWGGSRQKRSCAVDFESANLSGGRFWLRYFQPVCYSVLRSIDSRVVWPHAGA